MAHAYGVRGARNRVCCAPVNAVDFHTIRIMSRREDSMPRIALDLNTEEDRQKVKGQIDRSTVVLVGINASQRVELSNSAVPSTRYVSACLVLNGPLAEPRGGIFMRYATLAFESSN